MRGEPKMKNKKIIKLFWITMIVVLIPTISLTVHAEVADISGHWAEDVISDWANKGLANGYPDGTFRPNKDISRAEFIKLVNNAFEYTEEKEISFTDVSEDQWFYSTIKVASSSGYIQGYDDGSMRPNKPITREEVATIISRITNLEGREKGVIRFSDAANIGWSKGFVGAVVVEGYMQGYPDGTFMPQKYITRAESIKALDNIINQDEDSKVVQAIAKQDFFGITYIQITLKQGSNPTAIKANGKDLTYDSTDGKWKRTSLELYIGDIVEVSVLENGVEEKFNIVVEDIVSN